MKLNTSLLYLSQLACAFAFKFHTRGAAKADPLVSDLEKSMKQMVTEASKDKPVTLKSRNLIRGFVSQGLTPNEEESKRYLRLAGASYCPTETLKTWKCGHCQKLSTVEYQQTIEDPSTQTRAIIAVDKTKKEIIISFRGSSNLMNWFQNVQTLPFNSEQAIIDATVHKGFKTCNDNLKKLYIPVIKKLVKKYPKFTVVVTGHSLGGAVATLATLSINFEVRIKFSKMRLVTFCQPRVGNDKFASWMNKNVLDSTRFTNNNDPVPRLPISSFGFVHQHTEVYIKGNTAKVCSNKVMEDNTCLTSALPSILSGISDHTKVWGIGISSEC